MNARFYIPGIARFASADTIVPDPTDPQSYNRYSYVYNNPIKLIDPSGHCAITADGKQDTSTWHNEKCWNQFFEFYKQLSDRGESAGSWLGPGKDWTYMSLEDFTSSDGHLFSLTGFLYMRNVLHDEEGYYCGSVQCVENSYYAGEYSDDLLEFDQAPAVCTAVAHFSKQGGGACVGLSYLATAKVCATNDAGTCITEFAVGELGGKIFSTVVEEIFNVFNRSISKAFGREVSTGIVDILGNATDNGGISDPLTVVFGSDTKTVYAPVDCVFNSCESRIATYISEKRSKE